MSILAIIKMTKGFLCVAMFANGMWNITFFCMQLIINRRNHPRLLFWVFGLEIIATYPMAQFGDGGNFNQFWKNF
jgi:hypothetical protein